MTGSPADLLWIFYLILSIVLWANKFLSSSPLHIRVTMPIKNGVYLALLTNQERSVVRPIDEPPKFEVPDVHGKGMGPSPG